MVTTGNGWFGFDFKMALSEFEFETQESRNKFSLSGLPDFEIGTVPSKWLIS
jgi:hypothetical protein